MLSMKTFLAIQQLIKTFKSPTYIMLVGPPGVGKSTFIKEFLKQVDNKCHFHIASTDNLIEIKATEQGITYNDYFHIVDHKKLRREMEAGIELAFHADISIIHDQTNMSKKSRASKLYCIPDNYQKFCLNFKLNEKTLQERLDNRGKLTGKTIPDFVVKSMLSNYEEPSKLEGFDFIFEINNE